MASAGPIALGAGALKADSLKTGSLKAVDGAGSDALFMLAIIFEHIFEYKTHVAVVGGTLPPAGAGALGGPGPAGRETIRR